MELAAPAPRKIGQANAYENIFFNNRLIKLALLLAVSFWLLNDSNKKAPKSNFFWGLLWRQRSTLSNHPSGSSLI